jgi:hypothetical protein
VEYIVMTSITEIAQKIDAILPTWTILRHGFRTRHARIGYGISAFRHLPARPDKRADEARALLMALRFYIFKVRQGETDRSPPRRAIRVRLYRTYDVLHARHHLATSFSLTIGATSPAASSLQETLHGHCAAMPAAFH